ncbi:DUF2497 domain-containing protein [Rhodopseudomonas boonkerdii]|uniref:PopZ family protein n=1 Tax=Rhodopseudomonas boonkerdii TaxID=475937 RepID=UPI001E3BD691|nr:DUF2497 domain-containing protein [Rhodopseudomonas boonkerdii]UGV26654.1 DUF2497 domain-containing protein [Rhodopseudomonas boonkerdii]
MTQPAKVQEPSMEEILASIRRIIADDEAKPAEPAPAPAAPPAKPAVVTSAPPPAPKPAPVPKAPEKAPEPAATNSQDDIDAMLASFDAATPEPETSAVPSADDVFELTDEMVIAEDPEPAFRRVEPADDLEFAEAAAANTQPPRFDPPSYEPPPHEQPVTAPQMMSPSTASAVESAFHSLANTVLSNNARTLEDLVKEMLRPMLKSWLDDNLPGLVERIVKAEIERVSRGGGR